MSKKLRAANKQLRRQVERQDVYHKAVFQKLVNKNWDLSVAIAELRGSMRTWLLCFVRPWI